mmetsp:Transcript_10378/g.33030  ORF Transcript_10378/g.33030 Transcript_10378/m.33030 type:complete len:240 (+) Transcript_10378:3-722(+)
MEAGLHGGRSAWRQVCMDVSAASTRGGLRGGRGSEGLGRLRAGAGAFDSAADAEAASPLSVRWRYHQEHCQACPQTSQASMSSCSWAMPSPGQPSTTQAGRSLAGSTSAGRSTAGSNSGSRRPGECRAAVTARGLAAAFWTMIVPGRTLGGRAPTGPPLHAGQSHSPSGTALSGTGRHAMWCAALQPSQSRMSLPGSSTPEPHASHTASSSSSLPAWYACAATSERNCRRWPCRSGERK